MSDTLTRLVKAIESRPPDLDARTEGAGKLAALLTSLEPRFPEKIAPLKPLIASLQAGVRAALEKASEGLKPREKLLSIPIVPPETMSSPGFEEFLKDPCPVVFRGAASSTEAVRLWTPEHFAEKYGDFPCYLWNEKKDHVWGTLKDVVADIRAGRPTSRYAQNVANIFNEHPVLEEQLELDRFLSRLGPRRHLGTHLFLGGKGTGSDLHCNSMANLFFNVHGVKRWFFIHPKHTAWIDGYFHESLLGGGSPIPFLKGRAEEIEERFPLFKYVPVYTADLQPGDVLYNPYWWWHAIENRTDATIAAAVRWIPTDFRDLQPTWSLVQDLVPEFKREYDELLRSGRLNDDILKTVRKDTIAVPSPSDRA